MSRPIAKRAIDELQRLEKRDALAKLRVRQRVSRAGMVAKGRELRASAKSTLARIRLRTAELRAALRLASAAARELSRYIAPGARVLISREQAQALRTLAAEHKAITHQVTAERARLTSSGSPHPVQRSTAAERAAESDDEVRANIERELLPAFEAWRRRVRATPRMTRTEAFLQLVHDNPADAARLYFEAQERAALEEVEENEREYAERQRRAPAPRAAKVARR